MSVKLTIGSAVCNVEERFLRAHIEGILRQLTDETELLLIDDGSTDGCGAICRAYAAKHSRVRYVPMGERQGLSCVRNRTIDEARGAWIFFADGDDLLSDHFVENALQYSDFDADIILHERLVFLADKGVEAAHAPAAPVLLPANAGQKLSLSVLCAVPLDPQACGLHANVFFHAAWGALYRRDFLVRNDLRFPPEVKKAQDSVFNGAAYFHAQKIACRPCVMYYYRNNPQGITKRYSADYEALIRPLLAAQRACLQRLFPGDPAVEALYLDNRVVSFVTDSLRLNYCHPDNPKPRTQRKAEFFAFAAKAPFQSAVQRFDFDRSDRITWAVQIRLIQKKRFAALDFLLKHPAVFSRVVNAVRSVRTFRSNRSL